MVVWIIQRPVGENIHFRGFQNADAFNMFIQAVDQTHLFPQVFYRQAARNLQAARVIGDSDVL